MQETETVSSELAPALSEAQIVAEATNDPKLSNQTFTFGGREFTVVSLGYKQYLQFIARFKPILELLTGKVKNSILEASDPKSLNLQGIVMNALNTVDAGLLMDFCADDLPALVEIVCNMAATREDRVEDFVTAKWVEDNASSPFQLVNIVLAQVSKNNMIVEFASFFAQALPILLRQRTTTSQAK